MCARDVALGSDPRVLWWRRGQEGIAACVCAIGVFDGVHAGHRRLIGQMRAAAARRGLPAVVVTFDRDPACVLGQKSGGKLLSDADRIACLLDAGADRVCLVPFDEEVAAMPPDRFLEGCLGAFLGAREVHVGVDFAFGRRAAGRVGDIERWGRNAGCVCRPHELYRLAGDVVTSTRVRTLLAAGRVVEASCLLGRDHYVRGTVVHGRGAGRDLGFPTANVEADPSCALPAPGVYAGYVAAGGRSMPSAISVGVSPTFPDAPGHLECHVVDFDGDLYGREVRVAFADRLRAMMDFRTTDELVDTVLANVQWVRAHLCQKPEGGERAWA
ncbi:MAG: riboflavin biosynthesis protein RibF [Coriobacteriales bacterium]